MDTTPKQPPTRRLTLSSKHFARGGTGMFGRYTVFFPALLLTGKWLQNCGFEIGQLVDVSYEMGKLIITLAEEDGPPPGFLS